MADRASSRLSDLDVVDEIDRTRCRVDGLAAGFAGVLDKCDEANQARREGLMRLCQDVADGLLQFSERLAAERSINGKTAVRS